MPRGTTGLEKRGRSWRLSHTASVLPTGGHYLQSGDSTDGTWMVVEPMAGPPRLTPFNLVFEVRPRRSWLRSRAASALPPGGHALEWGVAPGAPGMVAEPMAGPPRLTPFNLVFEVRPRRSGLQVDKHFTNW